MRQCLIGHTGLVGGHLRERLGFNAFFNSANIDEIRGRAFERIVCAGVRAEKWLANRDPEWDWRAIKRLLDCLETVQADHFVLISTIDVFVLPLEVNEDDDPAPQDLRPYGRHRLKVEQFVKQRFPASQIVRLPGLFGKGLKKNAIFDFLTDNNIHLIDSRATYQFYDLRRLAGDLEKVIEAGMPLLHVATEPVCVEELVHKAFGRDFANCSASRPARYDFRSKYDRLWGGSGGYLYLKEQVLSEIREFVRLASADEGFLGRKV